MSAEHRENRPFRSIAQLDVLVQQAMLFVGDRRVEPDTSQPVSRDVFLNSPFVLRLAADETALRATVEAASSAIETSPYEIDDLALVVVASSPYLKIAEVLEVIPLAELADKPVNLTLTAGERPAAMQSPRSGCEVEVSVCLRRTLDFEPLRAWRRWTWLARSRFTIETEAAFTGFVPLPLDAARRKSFGLPDGTMRYIVIDSDVSVFSPDSSEDSLELYVDADLLALMSASERSVGSVLLQRLLFVDAVRAVVDRALLTEEIEEQTVDDIDGSLLDKVVRLATGSGTTPAQRQTMLDLLRERPAAFMALIEHKAELLDSAREVIGGGQ